MKLTSLLLATFLTACSALVPTPKGPPPSRAYQALPVENWQAIPHEKADFSFINTLTGSVILASSACQKYSNSNLKQLQSDILKGLDDRSLEKTQEIFYQERKALDSWVKGSVDGVPSFVHILSHHRDHCFYDFALIMTHKKNNEDEEAFQKFLGQIKFEKEQK
ncbi:MAG: hypothetical protein KBD63_03170 [Bacteriovoracaceae bacterium]|nr:hypothetical protein [Bacteriovoracaceae bacterium]